MEVKISPISCLVIGNRRKSSQPSRFSIGGKGCTREKVNLWKTQYDERKVHLQWFEIKVKYASPFTITAILRRRQDQPDKLPRDWEPEKRALIHLHWFTIGRKGAPLEDPMIWGKEGQFPFLDLQWLGTREKGPHLLGLLFGGKGAPLTKGRSIYNAMIGNLSQLETQKTLDMICLEIFREKIPGSFAASWFLGQRSCTSDLCTFHMIIN